MENHTPLRQQDPCVSSVTQAAWGGGGVGYLSTSHTPLAEDSKTTCPCSLMLAGARPSNLHGPAN